jgi:hypothetical protein
LKLIKTATFNAIAFLALRLTMLVNTPSNKQVPQVAPYSHKTNVSIASLSLKVFKIHLAFIPVERSMFII